MSTRCQIGFYESKEQAKNLKDYDALIYVHHDGYPTSEHGIPARIVPFLKFFDEKRGLSDTEYAPAWTLHHLIQLSIDNSRDIVKEDASMSKYFGDGRTCTGFGVSNSIHGDLDFFYKVYPGHLEVCQRDYNAKGPDKFRSIQIIHLDEPFVIPE